MIRVFIGYDSAQAVAYHVLSHSILTRASRPVSVTPVALCQLKGVYRRPPDLLASTEFSTARFLVPWLSQYRGWAIFVDCDMLMRGDVSDLWDLRNPRYAVMVVKHDHRPAEALKFLGYSQSQYPRKNWSSVMLLNCARCKALTPDYVSTAPPGDLHRFTWLGDDAEIGELPPEWNHLVDYDPPKKADLLHYTVGGPYFRAYRSCGYASNWKRELLAMTHAEDASFKIVGRGD